MINTQAVAAALGVREEAEGRAGHCRKRRRGVLGEFCQVGDELEYVEFFKV